MLLSRRTMSKNKTQTISISTLVKKLLQNSCYLMTYLHLLLYIQSLKMDVNSKTTRVPDTSIQPLV